MKVGIIGKGNVGLALGSGLARVGHEVKYGHRDPKEKVKDAAQWGDVIIFAVPFGQTEAVVKEIGQAADGKVIIDARNAIAKNGELAVGFKTSAAEALQKEMPKSFVVKAFNTVFAENQSTGMVGGEHLSAFIAGDSERAKQVVMGLAKDIGFDPVDAGSLSSARYLEPMAMLIINLGYGLKMGTNIGYRLVK
jgi:hypothetical protein